jgi:hypothetical protein
MFHWSCLLIYDKNLILDSLHVRSSNIGGIISSTFRAMKSQNFDYQGPMEQQGIDF